MKNCHLSALAIAALVSCSLSGCFSAPDIAPEFFAPEDVEAATDPNNTGTSASVDGEGPTAPAADDSDASEAVGPDATLEKDSQGSEDFDGESTPDASQPETSPDVTSDPVCTDSEVPCNGIDDDCDPTTLDDACPQPEGPGQYAACAGSICKTHNCEDGTQNQDGLGTGDEPCEVTCSETADIQCDGVDQDCDGVADTDDLCADQGSDTRSVCAGEAGCQTEACEPDFWDLDGLGSTGCEYSCELVGEGANDATCDGVDDDCDGETDEDHEAEEVTCGQGVCAQVVTKACVNGALEACEEGDISTTDKAEDDSLCDGLDNDCDGETDEEFVQTAVTCWKGKCTANGTQSCFEGELVESCVAGTGDADDQSCDGVDDDCDEKIDEDFEAEAVDCGDGACKQTFQPQCINGVATTCIEALPTVDSDSICDGVDDDCDGFTDEDASCERHCMESAGDETTLTVCREFRIQTYDEAALVEDAITSAEALPADDQTCVSGTLFDGRCPLVIGEVAEDGADTTMAQATGCEVTAGEEYRWFYAQTDSHTANHAVMAADSVEAFCLSEAHGIARQCVKNVTCDSTDDPDCLELCTQSDGMLCTELTCKSEPTGDELSVCVTRSNDDVCTAGATCESADCDAGADGADPVTGCVYTPDDSRCDDGEDCADETCAPGDDAADENGCISTLWTANTECSDRDLCTTSDTCDASGQCVGDPYDCSAEDTGAACREPLCFGGNCLMVNVNDGTECDHEDFCVLKSECQAGACVATDTVSCWTVCGPGGACPASGPETPPCTTDSDCYDGYPCTIDTCDTSSEFNADYHCDYQWRNDVAACSFETSACCTGGVNAGCPELKAVEHCVCELEGMTDCCTDSWEESCVTAAEDFCGLSCIADPGGYCGDGICDSLEDTMSCAQDCTGEPDSPCCDAQPEGGAMGCAADPDIEACVCGWDDYCCPAPSNPADPHPWGPEAHWDSNCVSFAMGCGLTCSSYCGDGVCDSNEDEDACPEDCSGGGGEGICGDGVCGMNEHEAAVNHCEADCGFCTDGVCDPFEGPGGLSACPEDCEGQGDLCNQDTVCNSALGETVENCPSDCTISPGMCGDGWCDPGEDLTWCSQDCVTTCGDGICEIPSEGANEAYNCPWDCPDEVFCDYDDYCDWEMGESEQCPDCGSMNWDTCEDPVCNQLWDAHYDCPWQCDDLPALPVCTHDSECTQDNACRETRCVLTTGDLDHECEITDLEPGVVCDDGDNCTQLDVCSAGACEGQPVNTPLCSEAPCADFTFGPLVDAPGLGSLDITLGYSSAQPNRGFVFSLQGRGLKTFDFETISSEYKPTPTVVGDVSFGGYAENFDLFAVDMDLIKENGSLTAYVVGPDLGMMQLYVDSGIHITGSHESQGAYLVATRPEDKAVAVATPGGIQVLRPADEENSSASSGLPFTEVGMFPTDADVETELTKVVFAPHGLYALHPEHGVLYGQIPAYGMIGPQKNGPETKNAQAAEAGQDEGEAQLSQLMLEGVTDTTEYVDMLIGKSDLFVLTHTEGEGYRLLAGTHESGYDALDMVLDVHLETDGEEILGIARHGCSLIGYITSKTLTVFHPGSISGGLNPSVMDIPYPISTISSSEGECIEASEGAWFALGGGIGGAALIAATVNDDLSVNLTTAGSRCRVGPSVDLAVTHGFEDQNLAYINDTDGTWKIDGPEDEGIGWHQLRILDLNESPPALVGRCTVDGTIAGLVVSPKDYVYMVVAASSEAEESKLVVLPPGTTECNCDGCSESTELPDALTPKTLFSRHGHLMVGGQGTHPLQLWNIEKEDAPKLHSTFPNQALGGMSAIEHIAMHNNRVFVAGPGEEGKTVITSLMWSELKQGVIITMGSHHVPPLASTGNVAPLRDLEATSDGTLYAIQGPTEWEEAVMPEFALLRMLPGTEAGNIESMPFGELSTGVMSPTGLEVSNDVLLLADPNYGVMALSHSASPGVLPAVLAELKSEEATYNVVAQAGMLYLAAGDSLMQSVELECGE